MKPIRSIVDQVLVAFQGNRYWGWPYKFSHERILELAEIPGNLVSKRYAELLGSETKPSLPTPAYAPNDSLWRKRRPIVRGCIDYFYDTLLEIAFLSWVANQKHNPGEELHWARGKSMDQADTLVRHLGERGSFDEYEIVNEQGEKEIVRIRHSVAAAWRALANAQIELEEQEGRPMSRGSRPATNSTPKETT